MRGATGYDETENIAYRALYDVEVASGLLGDFFTSTRLTLTPPKSPAGFAGMRKGWKTITTEQLGVGRELDALVTEKVMGYQVNRIYTPHYSADMDAGTGYTRSGRSPC